jgi:anti-anti-sigma regulatory factor
MSTEAARLVIDDGTARLILVGDASEQDVSALRDEVHDRLGPDVELLVIDLSACRFLDPIVVDLIGTTMGRADDRGIRMDLAGVSPNVRVILGIAGLLDFPSGRGGGAS